MPNARVVQIFNRMVGTAGVREKAAARRVAQPCSRGDVGCKFERSSKQRARRAEAHGAFVERLYRNAVG